MQDTKMPPQSKDQNGTQENCSHSGNKIPQIDANKIGRFLKSFGRLRPSITVKLPNGAMRTKRFTSTHWAARSAKMSNENVNADIYFTGNSHEDEVLEDLNGGKNWTPIRKPRKENIVLGVGAWLDFDGCGHDPEVIDELLHRHDWPPTYIVMTGGGLQAFWRFDEFVSKEDCECINRWMVEQFKDIPFLDKSCWTCEHLWRVPGTLNWKYDPPRLSYIVHEDWSARLPIDEVGRTEVPERNCSMTVNLIEPVTAPEWAAWVEENNFRLFASVEEMLKEVLGEHVFYFLWVDPDDRSAGVFRFLGAFFSELGSDPHAQSLAHEILSAPVGIDQPDLVSHCQHFFRKDGRFVERQGGAEKEATRQIQNWLNKQEGR